MKKIWVTQFFKFAHDGIRVEEFAVSAKATETTDECADLAVQEGWASFEPPKPKPPAKPPAQQRTKAIPGAPENKGGQDTAENVGATTLTGSQAPSDDANTAPKENLPPAETAGDSAAGGDEAPPTGDVQVP